MTVFVLWAREKYVLLLVVPEEQAMEELKLLTDSWWNQSNWWIIECGQIYRISLNLPRKARKSCHTCDILYMYSLVYELVINASDRGVQDTSVFPDFCLQSKTFVIRVFHTFSLWLNIAPVQYFFKALFNKVSFFGRQIFSLKRSYFLVVWENST